MHVLSPYLDRRRMRILFLAGTYDTSVRSLVKAKIKKRTCLGFPLRNYAGISGLFFLSLPINVIFLVKRKFASS
jgi:hypothetical protein